MSWCVQDVESRQLEVEELKKDLSNYEQQLAAISQTMTGYEEQLVQLKEAVSQAEVSGQLSGAICLVADILN